MEAWPADVLPGMPASDPAPGSARNDEAHRGTRPRWASASPGHATRSRSSPLVSGPVTTAMNVIAMVTTR